jgi:murein DD-endopeptidase MepM/ murein hydrolase activator NlpD
LKLNFSDFLKKHKSEFTWLLKPPLTLEHGSQVFFMPGVSDISIQNQHIQEQITSAQAKFAFGGYAENRCVYSNVKLFGSENPRTIHLGIDIWCEVSTPIYMPLNGKIHSFGDNQTVGDYGPTIITKHFLKGESFYLLFGHLNRNSLRNLEKDKWISQGEKLAELGDYEENGNWPPHLHFQIIKDIGSYDGDYPGVAARSDLNYYLENCPDPMIIF